VSFEEGKTDNDKISVTYENWLHYQEDSTVALRVKRLREKRRGEEKRRELKKVLNNAPAPVPPDNGFSSWPEEWKPIQSRIENTPILSQYKSWLSDVTWWKTMDELFTSAPKNLDVLLIEAAAYIHTEGYRPRTAKALRMKLRNCMEFSARRSERDSQREKRSN
jgi:hypothetical protein